MTFCAENKKEETKSVKKRELTASVENTVEFSIAKIPKVTNGSKAYFSPDGGSVIFNEKMGKNTTHYVYHSI